MKHNNPYAFADIAETLKRFVYNWYYFVISIVGAMTLVSVYLYLTPPLYKVSGTLLIQDDKNGAAMSNGTAFSDLNMFQTLKTVDNEIEILRSRDLLRQVLKQLHFDVAYFEKNAFKTQEMYGRSLPLIVKIIRLDKIAFSKNIAITILGGNQFKLTDDTHAIQAAYGNRIKSKHYEIEVHKGPAHGLANRKIMVQFKDLYKTTEAYNLARLKIVPVVKDANTIIISVKDNIPERGVDFLTTLISYYNVNNVVNKNKIAQSTIRFIDQRLKFLVNDLASAEQHVELFKQKNQVADIGIDAQLNATRSGEYNQLLASTSIQLGLIKSLEDYFVGKSSSNMLAPSAMGLKDPILNTLIGKFNELQLERNRMLRTAKAENPLVVNLSEQLLALKTNILENLRSVKAGVKVERNGALMGYAQYDGKIRSVPSIERGLLERSREQNVKSSLYQYLVQKREETALSLSTTVPTSQVIDKPAYHTQPDSPKADILYLCAFMFGCLVPAGAIYANGFLNRKVKDARAIQLTGVKLLGELSHNLDKNTIVFQHDNRSTISELFRYIRMNLNFMTDKILNKTILVTSGMQGEGKTFFSINLATTLGMMNKKVVVLEFDLRRPALLKKVNVKADKGIAHFIDDQNITINEIIRPVPNAQNVSVIGCGYTPENPSEMMINPRTTVLLAQLKKEFDYVIIDTSPVGQVADAFSLGTHVDASIYLVRYNYTSSHQLSVLKNINDDNKLNNLMVVFNDAKRDKNWKYSYGGYGYAMPN